MMPPVYMPRPRCGGAVHKHSYNNMHYTTTNNYNLANDDTS